MRGFPTLAAIALAATAAPASADDRSDRLAVTDGVLHFFEMMSDGTEAEFADTMTPEAVFFVHDRRNPEAPRVVTLGQADYLASWKARSARYEERMLFETVLVDGDMAHVWGPYVFRTDGAIAHCGINSIHLIRGEDRVWRLGNASFTMVSPDDCAEIGAPVGPQ